MVNSELTSLLYQIHSDQQTQVFTPKQKADAMISCPNCEYTNGHSGRPVITGDQAKCLTCGIQWKEYSSTGNGTVETRTHQRVKDELAKSLRSSKNPSKSALNNLAFNMPELKMGTGTVAASILCVLLLFAMAIYSSEFFDDKSGTNVAGKSGLEIQHVKVKTKTRLDGSGVLTVQGKISNNGLQSRQFSGATIVLKDARGVELTRWRYRSSKAVIYPGKSAMFSSSIPNTMTNVASAAILVDNAINRY